MMGSSSLKIMSMTQSVPMATIESSSTETDVLLTVWEGCRGNPIL